MSDLQDIKHRLIIEDKIEDLLRAIDCEYITTEQRGYLITAQLPERFFSKNRRSIQIKLNESLTCHIRSRTDFEGDIFNLISYVEFDKRGEELQNDLYNAKNFICETFGWVEYLTGGNSVRAKDYTACLKELMGNKRKKKEIKPNPVLPETILDDFYFYNKPTPYQKWIEEGISYNTQMMYGIGFDLESKRITIPMRNRFGQLVGIKGRIMKDEDDPERKYLYIYRYQNRYEWFNWHFAHPYILLEKKVYIFESEKSPMKMFDYGIYNALGIGASDISEEQAQMIKQLGLDIEIILCYDNDKKKKEIKTQAQHFLGRRVYAMYDKYKLLPPKSSPADMGIEVWKELNQNCIFPIIL